MPKRSYLLFAVVFISFLKLFYLFFIQNHFKKIRQNNTPNHIVLRVERDYRHNNYFKYINKDRKQDYFEVDVYKANSFTKIKKIDFRKLLFFFIKNFKSLFSLDQDKYKYKLLSEKSFSTNLAFYSYFSALFHEIKMKNPNTEIFHGGAALAADASCEQGLRCTMLSHGIIDPLNVRLIPRSSRIYVYSDDEKRYLEKRLNGAEIEIYPMCHIKQSKKTLICFLDYLIDKKDELNLNEVLTIFKNLNYKILFKAHPETDFNSEFILNLRDKYKLDILFNKELDAETLIRIEKPKFVLTWLSTAACESLRCGVIPICISEDEKAPWFNRPYPFRKRTIFWKHEKGMLNKIISEPDQYSGVLNLLLTR